jgi:2,3-dihydroxybenzoate-AMP ligase
MPDPVLGERVCLYLVPRPDASLTLAQIRSFMERAEVARFKLPERLVVVGELPSTKVGKVDKKALREDIARRLAADARAGAAT